MDDILKELTNDEKEFIKHHGISPSDIYDARGEIVKVYADLWGLLSVRGKVALVWFM